MGGLERIGLSTLNVRQAVQKLSYSLDAADKTTYKKETNDIYWSDKYHSKYLSLNEF